MPKNRFFFLLLSLCLIQTSFSQTATVRGTIELTNSNPQLSVDSAILNIVSGNTVTRFDSQPLDRKGSFQFQFNVASPTMYILSFNGLPQSVVHLMILPGDKVNLELKYDADYGFLQVVSAKGSKNVTLYQQFNQQLYSFTKQAKDIDNEYKNPATSEARRRELSSQFMQMQTSSNVAIRQLLEQNTDVLLSAFLVTYFDNDVETYIELFEKIENGLKGNYADNQFVQYVSSKVKSSLVPGRMAPEIAMKDPDGNVRRLSDLRGSVVMIDFWASWCRPCRMENPNVVKLYKKYHDKGFDIFSVSLDKSRADWVKAIAQDGLVWDNHVSDLNGWTSSGGAAYGITSVPSTVLVDRQGRIIARNLRGEQLEMKLKEIFGE